jgi:ABC-type sugar transport system substrate-binding protein
MKKIKVSRLIAGLTACSLVVLGVSISSAGAAAHKKAPYTVGFADQSLSQPFLLAVQSGMVTAASAAGDKIVLLNNNASDTQVLENAQLLANDHVNAVVEFLLDASVGPAIRQIFKKAGIKTLITVDVAAKGFTFFGASNYADGLLTGQALGTAATSKGWTPATTYVVSIGVPEAGPVPALRMTGMINGIAKTFPGIPSSQILSPDGLGATATSQTVTAAVLPEIPSTDHIIITGINDESVLGGLDAVQVAGRASMAIEGSQGQVQTNSNWIGDTAYFPELYAKYIFQVIGDFRAGKKVSPYVFMPHVFIDSANINEYYPAGATSTVKAPPGGIIFSNSPNSSAN